MTTKVQGKLEEILCQALGSAHLRALALFLGPLAGREVGTLTSEERDECDRWVTQALRFCPKQEAVESLRASANFALAGPPPPAAEPPPASGLPSRRAPVDSTTPPVQVREANVEITSSDDAVQARMLAKHMALQLGFTEPSAIRIATAVSELARNIIFYASNGAMRLIPLYGSSPRAGLKIVAIDKGPGIENLDLVMSGRYKSKRGLGLGLRGVKQLMDEMEIDTGRERGTTVSAVKWLS